MALTIVRVKTLADALCIRCTIGEGSLKVIPCITVRPWCLAPLGGSLKVIRCITSGTFPLPLPPLSLACYAVLVPKSGMLTHCLCASAAGPFLFTQAAMHCIQLVTFIGYSLLYPRPPSLPTTLLFLFPRLGGAKQKFSSVSCRVMALFIV